MTKEITPELLAELEAEAEKHWDLQYMMAKDESVKPYIINDFKRGALCSTAKKIHTHGMINLEEHDRRVKLEQAESQLTGACCAMRYGLYEVLNEMALKQDEWETLKKEYDLSYLRESDIETIEAYLSNQTTK